MKVILRGQKVRFGGPQLLRTWRGPNHLKARAAYSANVSLNQREHTAGMIMWNMVTRGAAGSILSIRTLPVGFPIANNLQELFVHAVLFPDS